MTGMGVKRWLNELCACGGRAYERNGRTAGMYKTERERKEKLGRKLRDV